MGRPNWRERICPKKRCYGDFEKLYIRRSKKMIPVGRRCATCGFFIIENYE